MAPRDMLEARSFCDEHFIFPELTAVFDVTHPTVLSIRDCGKDVGLEIWGH